MNPKTINIIEKVRFAKNATRKKQKTGHWVDCWHDAVIEQDMTLRRAN